MFWNQLQLILLSTSSHDKAIIHLVAGFYSVAIFLLVSLYFLVVSHLKSSGAIDKKPK